MTEEERLKRRVRRKSEMPLPPPTQGRAEKKTTPPTPTTHHEEPAAHPNFTGEGVRRLPSSKSTFPPPNKLGGKVDFEQV